MSLSKYEYRKFQILARDFSGAMLPCPAAMGTSSTILRQASLKGLEYYADRGPQAMVHIHI